MPTLVLYDPPSLLLGVGTDYLKPYCYLSFLFNQVKLRRCSISYVRTYREGSLLYIFIAYYI